MRRPRLLILFLIGAAGLLLHAGSGPADRVLVRIEYASFPLIPPELRPVLERLGRTIRLDASTALFWSEDRAAGEILSPEIEIARLFLDAAIPLRAEGEPAALVPALPARAAGETILGVINMDMLAYTDRWTTSPGGPYERLSTVPQAGVAFLDRFLRADATYYCVITAVDAQGRESRASIEVADSEATWNDRLLGAFGRLAIDPTQRRSDVAPDGSSVLAGLSVRSPSQ
jgi:hypothetical protein